jgi:hypothetical protein
MKDKIRKILLEIMTLNSIGIIFMTAIQFVIFDLKGQIVLTTWCGISCLIGNCLAGKDEIPETIFSAIMALINTFMLMYIPSNIMGKITAIALAILVIYFAIKIKKTSIKEIR